MAQLTLRSTRDSALTWEEGDANLLALDSDSPWKVSSDHITYNGKVGIGVDSTYTPVYDLDFGDGDSATVGITNGDLVVHVDGPNELKVWNNTVQSITVKTTGKVGINDSDPSEMLTVGGNLRVSGTALVNVLSANSFTDGNVSISAGNINQVKRLNVFDDTVEIQFGNLYSKTSGRRIEDWDSSLTNFGDRVPTSLAVNRALTAVDSNLTSRLDSYETSTNSRLDSFELSTNTRFDSFETSILSRFDSFETQVNADFNTLELNLTNQIDSLDTSLNLQISNLIDDQNAAFDSLELSLQTQINTLENNINNQFDSFETKINFNFNSLETNLQGQIDSLDASLNLQITNLINDQNNAFDSLEGSINATLATYDLDGVLAVGNTSTRSISVGALTSTSINTGALSSSTINTGALTSTTINTQNNTITAGSGTVTGSEFIGQLNGTLKNARTINGVSFNGSANIANTFNNGVKIAGSTISMSGSYTGTFTASGDVVAFSDVALKSNISPITEALERVNQIGGYTYNKIGDDHKRTGVLAQEIQEVLPEAVHTNEDGVLGVAYGNLTGLLIEAVKELSSKVKELESK